MVVQDEGGVVAVLPGFKESHTTVDVVGTHLCTGGQVTVADTLPRAHLTLETFFLIDMLEWFGNGGDEHVDRLTGVPCSSQSVDEDRLSDSDVFTIVIGLHHIHQSLAEIIRGIGTDHAQQFDGALQTLVVVLQTERIELLVFFRPVAAYALKHVSTKL